MTGFSKAPTLLSVGLALRVGISSRTTSIQAETTDSEPGPSASASLPIGFVSGVTFVASAVVSLGVAAGVAAAGLAGAVWSAVRAAGKEYALRPIPLTVAG